MANRSWWDLPINGFEPPQDNTPTKFPPGSCMKVELMGRRYDNGLALFAVGDATNENRNASELYEGIEEWDDDD